ncbi:hypothetical protein B296_00058563, partial [Ensete ventricosum]
RRRARQGSNGGCAHPGSSSARAGDIPARAVSDDIASTGGFPHPIDPGPRRGAAEARRDARPDAEQEEEEEEGEEGRRGPRSEPPGSGRRVSRGFMVRGFVTGGLKALLLGLAVVLA